MYRKQRVITLIISIFALAAFALCETRQEFTFKVHHRPGVCIVNQYGPITVRPGPGKRVAVVATYNSDKVQIDQGQRSNRIYVESHLLPDANAESGRVEFEVQVPGDASVTLHSTTGPLHAEKLHGDLVLEGNMAIVDVRDLSDGHVHVKTLNGPVTLTNVSEGHVEITSVNGDVALIAVSGPLVHVNSSSGKITYVGDFGGGGEYVLQSHTGDIEASAPAYASIDVVARSIQGKVENDFLLDPPRTSFVPSAGSTFAGTLGNAASLVKLLSFSGKIHLKKHH